MSTVSTEPSQRTDTRSRTSKKLFAKIIESKDASVPLLREMWHLRLAFLTLNISEQEDFAKFQDYCTRANTFLITFRDEHKALQGYYTFMFKPVEHLNKKALLIHSKYYYVNTGFRGHPKITSAGWSILPIILKRYGLKRMYFVAFTFPSSFISLSRTFGKVYTIQGENASDWEKVILENFARELNGTDWGTQLKLILNQNIPHGENKTETSKINQLRRQYLKFNPEWEKGRSLPIMMRFDWAMIKSVLSTSMRRKKRTG